MNVTTIFQFDEHLARVLVKREPDVKTFGHDGGIVRSLYVTRKLAYFYTNYVCLEVTSLGWVHILMNTVFCTIELYLDERPTARYAGIGKSIWPHC